MSTSARPARRFVWTRVIAMILKELLQMRRDPITFSMMIGVPLMQLILFGYAINSDPKNLPAAIHAAEESVFSRTLVSAMENSGYFSFVRTVNSPAEARFLLDEGEVAFVVNIPAGFSASLMRGERPQLLIEADATDPVAAQGALATMSALAGTVFARDLAGPLAFLAPTPAPAEIIVHRLYNPEGKSELNIVPGLLGVVLTMTMVMITALAVTRETERGTMENLLAMPLRPMEVMIGKIVPYIAVGFVQMVVVLVLARLLFGVPMLGSLTLLVFCVTLFIAANLAVGFTFSTVAKSQMQAMQMSFFFFLPSLLLSGFMFPFRGMPLWAQWIGEVLPLTHFLRIIRGILLKGNGVAETLPEVWPILAFILFAGTVAMLRYRQTLD